MKKTICRGYATNTIASRRRKKTEDSVGIADMKTYICKRCGKEYVPKECDRITYCSRECAFAYRREHPKPSKPKPDKHCPVCGVLIENRHRKYCGDECTKKYWSMRTRELSKRIVEMTRKPRKCKWCNTEFLPPYGFKRRLFCSQKCADQNNNWQGKIRARLASKDKWKENFTRISIYIRDGWICKICGQPVLRDADTYHPLAATIDHVVPLSRGGEHSRSNVQCAHRLCNSLKSDKIPGAISSLTIDAYRPMRGYAQTRP